MNSVIQPHAAECTEFSTGVKKEFFSPLHKRCPSEGTAGDGGWTCCGLLRMENSFLVTHQEWDLCKIYGVYGSGQAARPFSS